ncbi:MAG TPA: glycine--tRNA ligase subunit beta, partial [Halothiobacillaceae bacterium]|nr:glycine--tRNA ligase subunit beta [Halothiobacillaceae bacterium]
MFRMSNPADFLFELGTEELPPGVLARLAEALSNEISAGFKQTGLTFGAAKHYAAPRRLAVWVTGLADKTEPKTVEKRGPAVKAAFDADGNPTRAAMGFAQSVGTTVDALERMQTDKGEWLVFRSTEPGKAASTLIPDIVTRALDKLPIPKRMRWGNSKAEFIRPVHWLLCLHGTEVVPFSALDQRTGNITYGHRFHHPEPITINQPADYVEQLRHVGYVIADFAERRDV